MVIVFTPGFFLFVYLPPLLIIPPTTVFTNFYQLAARSCALLLRFPYIFSPYRSISDYYAHDLEYRLFNIGSIHLSTHRWVLVAAHSFIFVCC